MGACGMRLSARHAGGRMRVRRELPCVVAQALARAGGRRACMCLSSVPRGRVR